MFTGIIQDLGTITALDTSDQDIVVSIRTQIVNLSNTQIGDSIAINGVCLTVTMLDNHLFSAEISNETLDKTTLKKLSVGQKVNLEKALTLSTPLGGHLVSGHVDGVGQLIKKQTEGKGIRYYFSAPKELMKFIATKGSVTIEGISLTVNHVDDNHHGFDVMIISHTERSTNLGSLATGENINLEIDLVARYIHRLLSTKSTHHTELTAEKIISAGY